ncbi:hypothetical protein EVAR_7242_1 [Eumeta japonica]|uniref:Uncharacterized protein n=1 Tax=Eumeta variegata TaxID=151549 RepID=A0A4C1T595_EUMVA|nr:hypothetical protein EVAR_7242_1 [Eumeta japonica]
MNVGNLLITWELYSKLKDAEQRSVAPLPVAALRPSNFGLIFQLRAVAGAGARCGRFPRPHVPQRDGSITTGNRISQLQSYPFGSSLSAGAIRAFTDESYVTTRDARARDKYGYQIFMCMKTRLEPPVEHLRRHGTGVAIGFNCRYYNLLVGQGVWGRIGDSGRPTRPVRVIRSHPSAGNLKGSITGIPPTRRMPSAGRPRDRGPKGAPADRPPPSPCTGDVFG